jgi:hypothetical protein
VVPPSFGHLTPRPAHDPDHAPQPRSQRPKPPGGPQPAGAAHPAREMARPRPLAGRQDERGDPARAAARRCLSVVAALAERSALALARRALDAAHPSAPTVRGGRPPADRPHPSPAGSRWSRAAARRFRQEPGSQYGRRRPTGAAPHRLARGSFPPPGARRVPSAPPRRSRSWRLDGRPRGRPGSGGPEPPGAGSPGGRQRHRWLPEPRRHRAAPRASRAPGGPSAGTATGAPAAAVR